MFDIDVVVREVEKIGAIINAPNSLLVIYSVPVGDGTPHVEIKKGECFYVSSERGCEFSRKKVDTLRELLYLIFERVTTRMAIDYELENRLPSQDCRRIIFSKKLELLGKINPVWEALEKKNIEELLEGNPYDDLALDRARYCRMLREKGLSEDEIDKFAYRKYPLPL